MASGSAPKEQVLESGTYEAKLVADDTGMFEDYDFATKQKTGAMIEKYWADLAVDGVADAKNPTECFRKRVFFKISLHPKAKFPTFLRAIGCPADDNGDWDTSPAVGKRWVTIDVEKYTGDDGTPKNRVVAYVGCKRKANDVPTPLPLNVDEDGWPAEQSA